MNKRFNIDRYSRFLIYIVAVVLVNAAGISFFFRADLTAGNVYSLSEASKKVVSTLSEPLTVKVFFSDNLPAPYNTIERYLHDLLEEYAVAGKSRFNYEFYNVSGEESDASAGNRERAAGYGIHPVQVQNIEQDEVKFQKAYMGMALIHGDIIETLPAITSTEGLEYMITSKIKRMNDKISALLRLEDNVAVKLILSSSLGVVGPYMNIEGLSGLPASVREITDRLNEKNFGKLSFSHMDPSKDPEGEKTARQYGVLGLNWREFVDRRGKKVPADRGYAGLIVEHGDMFDSLPLIEVMNVPLFGTQYRLVDLAELEDAINKSVEKVININEEIGYLADHGTPGMSAPPQAFGGPQNQDSLSALNKLLSEEYSVKEVHLEDGIPEGMKTLIIAGANEDFSDYELYQIDQFLMKGNSLAVFADPFKEENPGGAGRFRQPYYAPVHTGLEKLLAQYGLNMGTSVVLDENSYEDRVPRAFGGGKRNIYYAPIIRNEMINKDAAFMSNIKGLVMLRSAPVSTDEQKIAEHELTATRLFSSSGRSWEMKNGFNPNPMFMTPPADEKEFKSFDLAYLVEGSFPSYFADKPVPEHGDVKDGAENKKSGIDMSGVQSDGVTIRKSKPAKIFLIGTSEILKDNVIDEEGRSPNSQFPMNVVDYLNGREDIAVMRSKTQEFNPLKDLKPGTKTAVKTVNIAGLPFLVIVVGLVVWFRRSSRKRVIQRIFGS